MTQPARMTGRTGRAGITLWNSFFLTLCTETSVSVVNIQHRINSTSFLRRTLKIN
jgi:hypothetical protein